MAERLQRVQRRRAKGWRAPPGCLYVGRPTRWGNPWRVVLIATEDGPRWCVGSSRDRVHARRVDAAREAVDFYRADLEAGELLLNVEDLAAVIAANNITALSCFCPLHDTDGTPWPCHADPLIEALEHAKDGVWP